MKRVLSALIGLALIGPAFAEDDNPDPVLESSTVTRIEPGGFSISIETTPVVRVDGVNNSSVTTINVTKWQVVRVLKDGVQVGDAKREALGTRDATAWFMGRTNVTTGLPIALVIAPGRASWAAAAWNNSAPPAE